MRRRLRLPPFTHLIELTLLGHARQRVEDTAGRLAARLAQEAGAGRFALLGPAPHRVTRLRRTWRMCLLLKGRAVPPMAAALRRVLAPGRKFAGLPVLVDVDPL
jgi:primosomal protein N'